MNNPKYVEYENHHLTDVIRDAGEQLKNFVNTRVELLKSELAANVKESTKAAVYGVVALVFLATAYWLLTLAVVAVIAVAFAGNPFAWFFSLLIVGIVWLVLGGVIALVAKREFRGLTPKHTIRVLKQDKVWMESEARTQT
jgi:uncharacterized membrane protein YqjE